MLKQLIKIFTIIVLFNVQVTWSKENHHIVKTMVNGSIVTDTCYDRTKNEISSYVQSKFENIRELYNRRSAAGVHPEGKIVVEFLISSIGYVVNKTIVSNETGDSILACSLLDEIHEWQFSETRCPGTEQSIIYPFLFSIPTTDSLIDGPCKTYFESGKVKEDGNIKNGKQTGTWITYFENGMKSSLINYSNGKRNGESFLWNEEGVKIASFNYKNGLNNGKWLSCYNSGQKNICGYWKNGTKDSVWVEWYENGKVKTIVNYKNDKLHGKFEKWTDSGILIFECQYKNDKQEGLCKSYYLNGSIAVEGNYSGGKKSGIFKECYQDGTLISEKKFMNDTLVQVMEKK